jgi:hypothetical protein
VTDNSPVLTIEDPALLRLYSYWNQKRGARPCPARRDIEPLDLGYILGWIMLVDVEYAPLRFRFRLYGSNLVNEMKYDMTGRDLSEHPQPVHRAHIDQEWREVVERQEPTYGTFNGTVGGRRLQFQALRLPLSANGRVIDMLMVAVRNLEADPIDR